MQSDSGGRGRRDALRTRRPPLGDLWLGFDAEEIGEWMRAAGLRELRHETVGVEEGLPLVACAGRKTGAWLRAASPDLPARSPCCTMREARGNVSRALPFPRCHGRGCPTATQTDHTLKECTVEGRLLMADFKLTSRRCRIHQPSGAAVDCTFGEEMMDTVQEFLRRNVRVTGEAQIDADTNRIRRLAISDIEPVTEGEEGFEDMTAEDFWQEKSIDRLAEEQGVRPVERLEDILGRGADLWDDDEDFEAFLRNVERGRQDRESA